MYATNGAVTWPSTMFFAWEMNARRGRIRWVSGTPGRSPSSGVAGPPSSRTISSLHGGRPSPARLCTSARSWAGRPWLTTATAHWFFPPEEAGTSARGPSAESVGTPDRGYRMISRLAGTEFGRDSLEGARSAAQGTAHAGPGSAPDPSPARGSDRWQRLSAPLAERRGPEISGSAGGALPLQPRFGCGPGGHR